MISVAVSNNYFISLRSSSCLGVSGGSLNRVIGTDLVIIWPLLSTHLTENINVTIY